MTKVGVVEGNDTTRDLLVELIKNEPGLQCVCACADTREGLAEIQTRQPDVVLMDIHLPDQSGVVCAAELTGRFPKLQIIMLTDFAETDLIFQALKAGASGYLPKLSLPTDAIRAIAEVQAGGAPRSEAIARMVVRSCRVPSKAPNVDGLTARETEILELLAQGLSNKEIAEHISISPGTVRNHLGRVFEKLHVRCRTEAATKFLRAN